MRVSTTVIGILLFAGLFGGFYSFVNELGAPSAYNVDLGETDYTQVYEQTAELNAKINTTYDTMTEWSVSKDTSTLLLTLIPDALALIKDFIIFPFTATISIYNALADALELPSWFTPMFIGIITILIFLAVVALILRYKDT